MSSLLEEWIWEICTFYASQLSWTTPLETLVFLVIGYGFLMVLFYVLPPVRRLADLLTYPSRFLHFVDHVETARVIKSEIEEEREFNSPSSQQEDRNIDLGTYHRYDYNLQEEGANLYANCSTFPDQIRISMAPWKRVFKLLIIYIALIPFLPLSKELILFHMYMALIIFHGTLPSTGDYQSILLAMVHHGLISRRWYEWYYVVLWSTFLVNVIEMQGDIIFPLFLAVGMAYLYLVILITTAQMLVPHTRSRYPQLRIPPENQEETKDRPKALRSIKSSHSQEFNYK